MRTLSDEARYFRFMTTFSERLDVMAERFTDGISHVALIAEKLAYAASRPPFGGRVIAA